MIDPVGREKPDRLAPVEEGDLREADEPRDDGSDHLGNEGPDLPPVPDFPKHPTAEDEERLLATLEAVLFASTEALAPVRLGEILRVPIGFVKEGLVKLAARLDDERRPYELREHGGAYRLYTRAEYYPFLLRLKTLKKVDRLTPAALETLAIIAYRQPVIRAEVEAIRGVKVGPLLRALLDRKLIRIVGRAKVPGAPLQYGTTQRFLDRFGLASLRDLPSLKELRQGRV